MVKNANEDIQKQPISEDVYKDIVTSELERRGNGGIFVWMLFVLCVSPNILNGFHVSSYTLLGHIPDDQWCDIDKLSFANWTLDERRTISQRDLTSNGCTVWNWDYDLLSQMSYAEALNYTTMQLILRAPTQIDCKKVGRYMFQSPESTFVTDWELVCDRAIQRTSAQVMLSLGKFFGSFSFGILADKFGRKSAFSLGATFFIVSSFICTFSPWYSLFLVGRFGLGSASSGLFYPAFTMVVENICLRHRSWMSIVFAASYPIGMIFLALAAYFVQPWRYLQLALSIPALLLILNCYLMHESPRWLITKGHYDKAYKVLFKKPTQYKLQKCVAANIDSIQEKSTDINENIWQRLKNGPLKQFIELFATWKVRRLILTSYFMFFVTSLSYYVTALNASNMSVSRYLYVAVTGIVDLPSYLVPVILLRYTGRRETTTSLFLLTGVALLMVLVVPSDRISWIISFAMLGRFGISSTYSVVTLYTAELYPTEIRNSALGTCSAWAHVGSLLSTYVVDLLGLLGWYIPTTICGCCVLVAGLLTLTLPETGVSKLTDRVEEVPSESETNSNVTLRNKDVENIKF